MSDALELDPSRTYTELRDNYNRLVDEYTQLLDKADARAKDPEFTDEMRDALQNEINAKHVEVEDAKKLLYGQEARNRARAQFEPIPTGRDRLTIREPDMYTAHSDKSFMRDLYLAQLKNDPHASERIEKHQRLEVEKRAVTTTTFGGIIPPQYLVDMYAKASRNGRVFADQINTKPLPDVGMSLIVPTLTQGTSADAQASENSAAATQDPTESDVTVNVRTIAGYSPVSRQGLERAQYNDEILFEDLIARYWAQLDTQCLNGTGSSGQIAGLIGTSGIKTSAVSSVTVSGVYPKIADLAQQISTAMGGLGYLPDKLFMHPRRWGFFAAGLDGNNRPVIVPTGAGPWNAMGTTPAEPAGGVAGGFGGPVGFLQGFPVYLDPNIPTNLGTNTNEDRIIMVCSPVVHLWERANDPVTLSFEQQAGTSLQVQLVVYGYAAFTAARYPAASGVITGLTPPTF